MNLNAKYDVFVSYSRKDYIDEAGNPIVGSAISELLEFLDHNGITYWFDKDGIYSGSEFVEVITDAITESKMMIFVSSEHSNASPWTTGEIFEALEQEKLIVPFKIDDSQYNKKYRMMVRPLDFIDYFTNPEVAFDALLKAINLCKEEYVKALEEAERRKAEEDAKKRRAAIIEEIKNESLDYLRHASNLVHDAQKLVEKQIQVGNSKKKCPVCSTVQPIGRYFCEKCGWAFNPFFDAHPQGDKDHLFVMRSLWNAVHDSDAMRISLEKEKEVQEVLRKEKDTLMATAQSLKEQLEAAQLDAVKISERLKAEENTLRVRESELNQQLASAQKAIKEKDRKIDLLEKSLLEVKATLAVVQGDLKKYKEAEAIAKEKKEREAAELEAQKKAEEEKKASVVKVGDVEFKMIRVKGGMFTMGATPEMIGSYGDENPAHMVTLSSFRIGETLVTQALWKAVMGNNPSYFTGSDLPVETITWDDCQQFIRKLNTKTGKRFRLPTEAEWEFAARGGNESNHTQYSGSSNIDEVAWYNINSGSHSHPVKNKKANELVVCKV